MCDCIRLTNEALKTINTQLQVSYSLNGGPDRIVIATDKADASKKGRTPFLAATFCPICGQKYEPEQEVENVNPL